MEIATVDFTSLAASAIGGMIGVIGTLYGVKLAVKSEKQSHMDAEFHTYVLPLLREAITNQKLLDRVVAQHNLLKGKLDADQRRTVLYDTTTKEIKLRDEFGNKFERIYKAIQQHMNFEFLGDDTQVPVTYSLALNTAMYELSRTIIEYRETPYPKMIEEDLPRIVEIARRHRILLDKLRIAVRKRYHANILRTYEHLLVDEEELLAPI
jgi:hypothetical protein